MSARTYTYPGVSAEKHEPAEHEPADLDVARTRLMVAVALIAFLLGRMSVLDDLLDSLRLGARS